MDDVDFSVRNLPSVPEWPFGLEDLVLYDKRTVKMVSFL